MRLKLFKHVVWVCLEVVWGGLVEVLAVWGCFNGPYLRSNFISK